MATYLRNLKLSELSLVDHPANKAAKVTIFKRDTAGSSAGDPLSKKESPMSEDIKKVAELEAQLAAVTKRAEEAEAEVAKKVEAIEKKMADELAKRDAEIAKERDSRELVELTKRAEADYGFVPGEPIAKAKLLKAASTWSEDDRKFLETTLKAANAAFKQVLAEKGVAGAGNGEDDPVAKFDAAVAKYQAENKVSKAVAMDAVSKSAEGQRLYADARAEQRQRARAA